MAIIIAYRREGFENHLFDEGIHFGADESEFQSRLQKAGVRGTTFPDILIHHQHRNSFFAFSQMRWKYAEGHVYVCESQRKAVFNWDDIIFVGFALSLLYAILLRVWWLWAFPLFFFLTTLLHERKQGSPLEIWIVDVYVSLLWTLSKFYYSLKYHLRRWGWL